MIVAPFVLGAIVLVIQQYADFYRKTDLDFTLKELEHDLGLPRIETYDFIIVGGGSAGCILAARLSEKLFRILLLEKGGNPVPPTYAPYYDTSLSVYSHPAISDGFTSIPQTDFALDNNGIVVNFAGRMMGGSGSYNGNIYNRGSPSDFNYWANVTRDKSWSYPSIVPHFKRIENFVGYLVNESERDQYGAVGPLRVTTDLPYFLKTWLQAGKELGYRITDANAHQQESFVPTQITIRNGEKDSAYTSFIQRRKFLHPFLTVLRYSEVDQVLLNDQNAAYGVLYRRHGMPQIAHARREVILSAGALTTPQILIRSGIGPEDVLRAAKIPIKKVLPGVGQNLWDHAILTLTYQIPDFTPITDIKFQEELRNFHSVPYRHGALASLNGAQAFISSQRAKADGEGNWPDLKLSLFAAYPNPFVVLVITLMRPKSSGELVYNTTLHLQGESSNTRLGNPDYRYFSDSSDISVMIEGIRLGRKVLEETEAFRGMNLSLVSSVFPESCKNGGDFGSDAFWTCVLKRMTTSERHYSGTCRMGRRDDALAVVGSTLKVMGVDKLRVVDASVMPTVVNSNINAPTMLIAEKTSRDIIQEHLPFLGK